MSTQPDVDGLIRETRRYEFADGLVELQMGVLLTIMGALSQLVFRGCFRSYVKATHPAPFWHNGGHEQEAIPQ